MHRNRMAVVRITLVVTGLMMGVWFLASAVGNYIGGRTAGFYEQLPLWGLFGLIAVIVVGALSFSRQRGVQLAQAGMELERIQATMGIGDPDLAKVGLSQYLEQFGGTPYAGEAAQSMINRSVA